MNYPLRLLLAIDQLLNVLICNGEPDETMSSAVWRMERAGRFWGFMRPGDRHFGATLAKGPLPHGL